MVGGELLRPGAEAEAAAAENGGRGGDHGDRAQDGGGGRPGNRAQDGGGGLWPEELGRRLGPAKGQQQRRRQPAVLLLDCRHLLEYTKSQLQGAVNPGWAAGGGGGGPGPSGRAKITVFDLLAGRRTAARHPAPAPVTVPVPPPLSLHLLLDSLSPAGKDAQPPPPGDDGETDGSETSRPQGVPDGTSGGPGGDPHAANPSTPDIENAEISPILPFLYLGNERDAQDLARLRRLNVGYVINVTTHLPLYHAQAGAMHYKRLPATDNSKQNLRQYFEEAFEFIEEAHQSGKGVLVHCQAGVSRSATLVIAYLMKHTLMTMTDAYKYVKGKRLIISPNLNFMGQLLEFEMDLNKGLTPRILIPRLTGLETEV
uniref:dual specificity protein phosphatase 10-like n=1 Tax=Pristiophorus japonicus TaxID=55135 RepID=UPI00398F5561